MKGRETGTDNTVKTEEEDGVRYLELQFNVDEFFSEYSVRKREGIPAKHNKGEGHKNRRTEEKGAADQTRREETDGEATKASGHQKGVAAYHDLRHTVGPLVELTSDPDSC